MRLLYFVLFANVVLFVFCGLKSFLFKSSASYKTMQKGVWLISPNPVSKFTLVIFLLSWGSIVAFDEPWIKRIKGKGKVTCFDTSDPLCIDGFLHRSGDETALVIAMGIVLILISLWLLTEKGVIIDSRSIRREWECLPFKFSTKIDIENALMEKGMRGEMPILKIKDGQSGKNFTLSFPYAQQDIKFIEAEIRKRSYKMIKSKEAKAPLKSALKKTISLKGANERANIEILKNDKEGAGD